MYHLNTKKNIHSRVAPRYVSEEENLPELLGDLEKCAANLNREV